VTSLSKAYLAKGQPEFLAHLQETQTMIGEELTHLKATVNKFSEFARMPQVQLADADFVEMLDRLVTTIRGNGAGAGMDCDIDWQPPVERPRVRLDHTLFRQVLLNLLRNGIEANPGRRVRFVIELEIQELRAILRVANDGVPVAADIVDRMFDPYISTKSGKENMGLGLAIVKKIVLEHGGDIRYEERAGHPLFVLSLPRVSA
jgi:signal transduction histidine kinase